MQQLVAEMLNSSVAVSLLIEGENASLWDSFTQREALRFLRIRGSDIQADGLEQLCNAILAGPPREKYRDDLSDNEWLELKEHSIWLWLAKLRQSGAKFTPEAEEKIINLERCHSSWKLAEDFSDEFPFYTGAVRNTPSEMPIDFANVTDVDFQKWAMDEEQRKWNKNGWDSYCDKNPQGALERLASLAGREVWPNTVWQNTLWRLEANNALPLVVIDTSVELVAKMPVADLQSMHGSAARWLQSVRKFVSKENFLLLWQHIWDATQDSEKIDQPSLTDSLNHGAGALAEALINAVADIHSVAKLGEEYEIPEDLQNFFNIIMKNENYSAKLARIRMAANLLYLFRIAPEWTRKALIQRMNPNCLEFEPSIWQGYFWSPKLADDLLEEIAPSFVAVLKNLDCIPSDVHDNAVQLFIVAAIPPNRNITSQIAKAVLQNVGIDGLQQAAWMLNQLLKDSEDRSLNYWREVVQPWFEISWPTHSQFKVPGVSKRLVWMAIDSGDAFPAILHQIEGLLTEEDYPTGTIRRLKKNDLHKRYPEEALILVNKIVGDASQRSFLGSDYDEIIREINNAQLKPS